MRKQLAVSGKRIVICMPAYNEKDNVSRIIDALCKDVFPRIKDHEMTLLLCDDYSPDGTGEIVKEKMKKYKTLKLLQGKKEGLGIAYRRGFEYAIKTLKADAVMEMDADFQHNPNDVPRFVTEFENGGDYIIGSRYVSGGSIPAEWGFDRKFLSVMGNLTYRVGLWIWDVHDFTTGYRLARVKGFLDSINFDKVFIKTFAYKTLLLEAMKKKHAKIKEIPIKFNVREAGDSKMTTNTIVSSLKIIFKIWKERLSL